MQAPFFQLICADFKNATRYLDKIFQNFKIGEHSWDLFFSLHFFVRNMGKLVPLPIKMVFFLIDKNRFYRVRRSNFSSERFKKIYMYKYRYNFKTVKSVFFDLKKHNFFGSGTIFSIFLIQKNVPKKNWSQECAPLLKF